MVLMLDGNSGKGAHVKEQSMIIDLFKAFDLFEVSHKSDILSSKRPIFL